MLYLDLLCSSVSKICAKVSEKPIKPIKVFFEGGCLGMFKKFAILSNGNCFILCNFSLQKLHINTLLLDSRESCIMI